MRKLGVFLLFVFLSKPGEAETPPLQWVSVLNGTTSYAQCVDVSLPSLSCAIIVRNFNRCLPGQLATAVGRECQELPTGSGVYFAGCTYTCGMAMPPPTVTPASAPDTGGSRTTEERGAASAASFAPGVFGD